MEVHAALITGASSGIGEALALELARPGVTLHLSGRNQQRLEAVAEACRARGAAVDARVIDVRDTQAMAAWIDAAAPLGLVVANAGISAGTGEGAPETADQVRAIFATNVDGVLNTVLPAMQVMARQRPDSEGLRGRIAAVASIAAFIASPGAPAYCAAKAAVDAWIVASRPGARASGIALTSVCPGFVRTAMTAGNRFAMPGLMDAERAARITLRGIAAGRARVVFPWWMGLLTRVVGALPPRAVAALARMQPGKDGVSPQR